MLKRKISKEEFEAMADGEIKSLYQQDGDGNYSIKIEEDQGLVNALARTKEELAKKESEAAELTERVTLGEQHLEELRAAHGKGKTELTAIEEAWKKKFADLEAKSQREREEQTAKIRKAAVDAQALKIASEICVAPELMTPIVAERLTADFHEGTPIIRVLDKEGKPSAVSLTELSDEFKNDKRFEKVIIASKASGGGAQQPQNPTGSAASRLTGGAASPQDKSYVKMSAEELAAAAKAKAAQMNKP